MKEFRDIVTTAKELRDKKRPFAVAGVVRVEGSAYRRPGARMLIDEDGSTYGSISGGCLESEVAALAIEGFGSRTPSIRSFEMGEDDYIKGFGTGCGGDIDILIEYDDPSSAHNLIDLLEATLHSRNPSSLATVIRSDAFPEWLGQRVAVWGEGLMMGELPESVADDVQRQIKSASSSGRPVIVTSASDDETVDVLIEKLDPPIRVVLFGDGPDVRPVTRMCVELGWPCVVVGRKDVGDLQRQFPEAGEHVFLMHPEKAMSQIQVDPWSAVVIMTHTYLRDRSLLEQLLPSPARYVGALGPRARTGRMVSELRDAGVNIDEEKLERLHGPAGLDIGTETPEEIALAITSEILAVFRNRAAGALRDREGPIHERIEVIE